MTRRKTLDTLRRIQDEALVEKAAAAEVRPPTVPVLAELAMARQAVERIKRQLADLDGMLDYVERCLGGGLPERVRQQDKLKLPG